MYPLIIPCLLIVISMLLSGCNATMSGITKVPVPVACQEEVPDRPVMPTESLSAEATLDQFVQAAAAEIERREGFELKLHAALTACVKPIASPPQTPP
jgi:hypothetical protein